MSLKKYKSLKVSNPFTDGYAVKLCPRQGFYLSISRGNDEQVDILTRSEYVTLEDHYYDEKKNRDVYFYHQNYDLEVWDHISSFFLGNITITIRDKVGNKKSDYTICLQLNCSDKRKINVLTVINPYKNLVRIEPNQILHVVLFDELQGRWSFINQENSGMSCARSETVYNDVSCVYDSQSSFCPEPRSVALTINPQLTEEQRKNVKLKTIINPEGMKEFHFWTHLNLSALKKARSTVNGIYPMHELNFVCKSDDDVVLERKGITPMLSLRGNNKKITADEFKIVRQETKSWNATYVSSVRRSVISPKNNESIDLFPGSKTLYLEIPNPSVYLNRTLEGAYWFMTQGFDAIKNLSVKELAPRHVNSIMVQRFLVNNIEMPNDGLLFIGVLRFICKSKDKITIYNHNQISVNLWKASGACEDKRAYSLASLAARAENYSYNYSGTSNVHFVPQTNNYSQSFTEVEFVEMQLGIRPDLKTVTLDKVPLSSKVDYSCYYLDDDEAVGVKKKVKTRQIGFRN